MVQVATAGSEVRWTSFWIVDIEPSTGTRRVLDGCQEATERRVHNCRLWP